jgi:hypothetical protein
VKKLFCSLAILSLTGCAQFGQILSDQLKSSTELAMESCQKIGYQPGTENYRQCVMNTANNIRQARATQSAASENIRQSMTPRHTDCWSNGAYISCTSSRF